MIAAIAEVIFLSDHSDNRNRSNRSNRSDYMETSLYSSTFPVLSGAVWFFPDYLNGSCHGSLFPAAPLP